MWDHMTRLIHELRQSSQYQHCLDLPILPNLHYIWITRRDKIRQAVSWDIAVQTGIFLMDDKKPPALKTRPIFDFNRIDFLYCRIMAAESSWQRYFNNTGTIPFIVVYEDLIENYNQTLLTIFHQLNIPLPGNYAFRRGQLKKMSDAVNEDWIQRYKEMQVDQKQDAARLHRHIAQMLT